MRKIVYGCMIAATLIACGKSPAPQQNPAPAPQPTVVQAPTAPQPSVAPVPPKPTLEVKLASVGNSMAFDITSLTASAGQPVHVLFTNKSNMSTMGHNWALVKPGTEASVALKGLQRGEKAGYVDVTDHDMLAFTPMAKAGETTEVTFNAPDEPGVYPYICTFPGHYMMMKGKLTVTP